MTSPTHIAERNGSSRMPLVDDIRPYPEQIKFTLNRMNGSSFWAWSLWRAPEGADLLESLPASDEYIQCAGTADALTVEVRKVDSAGTAHQYVVGRPAGDADAQPPADAQPSVVIRWDDGRHSTTVHPSEVFTADEAAEIFSAYQQHGDVPAQYALRALDLG